KFDASPSFFLMINPGESSSLCSGSAPNTMPLLGVPWIPFDLSG
ncbi:hypothetical protein CSUI_010975, partial [Cystoisospora suis]